nr:hypothetical protein [uncultured Methanobrevibacter sp.]
MSDKKINIEVEEVNLEDLIVLGEDKLVNILIEYPSENEEGLITIVKSKAKIKQLTLNELRNLDLNNITVNTAVNILKKALYKQDETPFTNELILALPIGVSFAIAREIMKISGVDEDQLGF